MSAYDSAHYSLAPCLLVSELHRILNPAFYAVNINCAINTTFACKASVFLGLGHCACNEESEHPANRPDVALP